MIPKLPWKLFVRYCLLGSALGGALGIGAQTVPGNELPPIQFEVGDSVSRSTLFWVEEVRVTGLYRTRPKTVLREMTFGTGARIPRSQLDTLLTVNQRLVYNTGLFNRVSFRPTLRDTLLYLEIEVAERWYLWPEFIFQLEDQTVQDWLEDPDWERVTIGGKVVQRNLTGRNDNLAVGLTRGFERAVGVEYGLPFLIPSRLIGAGIRFQMVENDEVLYGSESGELLRVRQNGETLLQQKTVSLSLNKRYSQFLFLGLGLSYQETKIADTLQLLNPEYLYNPSGREQGTGFSAGIRYDTRDVRRFPLSGDLLAVGFSYQGLDPWLNAHYGYVELRYFRYRPVVGSRWFTALGGTLEAILGRELAYRNKLFLGNNGVRGFNSYAIDGTVVSTAKAELKYALVPRHIVTWKNLPRQFQDFPIGVYPYFFADTGIVLDGLPELSSDPRFKDKPLFGWGVGVDIPHIYDNLLRIEYVWNSFGESGILFNFSVALR